ncbi:hypothetical protein ABPG74_011302 [Tetrahymena malaccensis]
MSIESKVFYSFSKDCDKFLLAHQDNKASLWNCLNGTEQKILLQKEFLNTQIESLDLAKKKGLEIVVFANNQGKVLLYNVKNQEQSVLAKSHTGSVFDIKFNEDSTHFYTISSDKKLFKYDLQLKDVTYVKEIKRKNLLESGVLAPVKDNVLFAYENKLTLLDTVSDSEVLKYKGHSKNIKMIRVAKNNTHFATFSDEGFINVYNIKEEKPVHSVNILSKSNLVNFVFENTSKNAFTIVALHHDFVETWEFTISKQQDETKVIQNSNKSIKLTQTNILYIAHSPVKTSTISVAYGNNVSVQFQNVKAFTDNKFDFEEFKKSILTINAKKEVKVSKQAEIENKEKEVYVLNEKDQTETKNLNSMETEEDKQANNETILEYVKKVDTNNESKIPEINSVQSLAVVLLQALQNNDTQLIDFCLEKDNEDLIDQTVRGMISTKVIILLEKLYERLNTLPYKGRNLGRWLKAILKYHSTILITSPSIHVKLQPLMVLIENRTKNIDKLIGLRGKIDMVLALRRQTKVEQEASNAASTDEIKRKPLVVYEEGDNTIEEEDKRKILQKPKSKKNSKKAKDEEFSDSVSESDSEEEDQDDDDIMGSDESDVDKDFDNAARQHIKERQEKYKNINFDADDDDEIDMEEDSDFIEM